MSETSLFQTLCVSVCNYYHPFAKHSRRYNKTRRCKALLAQPLLFPGTIHIFFHPIRSCMVGEGQEWLGGGKRNLRSGKCVKI